MTLARNINDRDYWIIIRLLRNTYLTATIDYFREIKLCNCFHANENHNVVINWKLHSLTCNSLYTHYVTIISKFSRNFSKVQIRNKRDQPQCDTICASHLQIFPVFFRSYQLQKSCLRIFCSVVQVVSLKVAHQPFHESRYVARIGQRSLIEKVNQRFMLFVHVQAASQTKAPREQCCIPLSH